MGTTEAEVGVTMVLAWPGAITVGRGEATVVGINMLAWGLCWLLVYCRPTVLGTILHSVFCFGFQVRSNDMDTVIVSSTVLSLEHIT